MFLSRGDRDLGVAFQTHPGRQAIISSGSKEPRSTLESRRVSLGAHWAHLTSHSRMSGSRSLITSLWLSGSWRSFFVQFRGWDGWMASPTQWTWVWVKSGSWWWTGRPGKLQFMGSQRVGHDWETELNWITHSILSLAANFSFKVKALRASVKLWL